MMNNLSAKATNAYFAALYIPGYIVRPKPLAFLSAIYSLIKTKYFAREKKNFAGRDERQLSCR
jgi:hypothetical protein